MKKARKRGTVADLLRVIYCATNRNWITWFVVARLTSRDYAMRQVRASACRHRNNINSGLSSRLQYDEGTNRLNSSFYWIICLINRYVYSTDCGVIRTAYGVLVTGNMFVMAAILMERNLQSVANYLIISLAFADLMVACLVMPLGAVYEVRNLLRYEGTSYYALLASRGGLKREACSRIKSLAVESRGDA